MAPRLCAAALSAALCLGVSSGCSGPSTTPTGTLTFDGDDDDSGPPDDTGATEPTSPERDALIDALGSSIWVGEVQRDGATRTVEQHFRARSGQWAELISPWGPGRVREMRDAVFEEDGETVTTTVANPITWPDSPEQGRVDSWTVEVVQGSPDELHLTRDGQLEVYTIGTAPPPTSGITGVARTWAPNDAVDLAFCDSGVFGFDYPTFFDFARGNGLPPQAQDVVADGALVEWRDVGSNDFAVVDVPGFAQRGGTHMDDTFNFVVTYRGTFTHPGGWLGFREGNDSVEDGIWVFLDDAAGAGGEADYFLEVHGFAWFDGTEDEPAVNLPAGTYDLEVMIVRCTEPIVPITLQVSVANGPWQSANSLPLSPWLDDSLFPAPF